MNGDKDDLCSVLQFLRLLSFTTPGEGGEPYTPAEHEVPAPEQWEEYNFVFSDAQRQHIATMGWQLACAFDAAEQRHRRVHNLIGSQSATAVSPRCGSLSPCPR